MHWEQKTRLLNQADIILISCGKWDRINYAESTTVIGMRWALRPPTQKEGQEENKPSLKYIYKHLLYAYIHAHIYTYMGFPRGSDSEESACNVGDRRSIPGLGRTPGRGHGNPLQYTLLENPHGVEVPGRLGSQRLGQDCATKHSAYMYVYITHFTPTALMSSFLLSYHETGVLIKYSFKILFKNSNYLKLEKNKEKQR